jgi:two-component system OmpR family sensor kinase
MKTGKERSSGTGRRSRFALSLQGRLVAGYTALFALLLAALILGESTVVRQILVNDRQASLPNTAQAALAALGGPVGPRRAEVGAGTALTPALSTSSEMVAAVASPDGSVLYQRAGSAVSNVDAGSLLDPRYTGAGAPLQPVTYQVAAAHTTFLVRLLPIGAAFGPRGLRRAFQGPGLLAPGDESAPVGAGPRLPNAFSAAPGTPRPFAPRMLLLTALSLRPVDRTVNTLVLVSLAASTLGLLVAAALGAAVARRALRPLERMTATAQAIATGGDDALDQRLRFPPRGDEVSRLATTFDHMLDRIQATIAERVRSEARLRRFAADASHELRTPLAAMRGYTEVLLMGGKDDPATADHSLHRMDAELARMTRLVSDLLTLARLDAGLPLHLQPLSVPSLLADLVDETRLLASRADRRLVVAAAPCPRPPGGGVAPGDPVAVLADPDRLHQIMRNLLHNAVKFTPDGGQITLSAALQDGAVALAVADTGPGIAPADLPHLFERFYRSDRARARGDAEAGGAGLGLAIAQGLAVAQGGHITVESTPGCGSTFTLVLPASEPSPASSISGH